MTNILYSCADMVILSVKKHLRFVFKASVTMGIYLSDSKDTTGDIENDEEKTDSYNFDKHPFLYVRTRKMRSEIEVKPREKVEVIGVFTYAEQGEKAPEGVVPSTYEYSNATIDIAYLNGIGKSTD